MGFLKGIGTGAVEKTTGHLASLRAGARFSNPERDKNSEVEVEVESEDHRVRYEKNGTNSSQELPPGTHGATAKQELYPMAKTWVISVVGRSARHRRRAPSGAVWSFVLLHHAFEASFRSPRASKLARNKAASTGTTCQFSKQYRGRHVVYTR